MAGFVFCLVPNRSVGRWRRGGMGWEGVRRIAGRLKGRQQQASVGVGLRELQLGKLLRKGVEKLIPCGNEGGLAIQILYFPGINPIFADFPSKRTVCLFCFTSDKSEPIFMACLLLDRELLSQVYAKKMSIIFCCFRFSFFLCTVQWNKSTLLPSTIQRLNKLF